MATKPAYTQARFTVQELIDIYNQPDKSSAIKLIESKGYLKIVKDGTQNPVIYIREQVYEYHDFFLEFYNPNDLRNDRVGLQGKNRIEAVFHFCLNEKSGDFRAEIQRLGFSLLKSWGDAEEIYSNKKVNYYFWYVKEDENRVMLIVIDEGAAKKLLKP